jgi:hypothetical protein
VSGDSVDELLSAVVASVDRAKLAQAVAALRHSAARDHDETDEPSRAHIAHAVLDRLLLSDILDDAILGARPGERSFPLRVFFGELGRGLDDDVAFALANAINFYFRVPLSDEAKMLLGVETSRLYYRFLASHPLDADLRRELSPLLATLLSTELERLRFECVDGARLFDSTVHEREVGSDASQSAIVEPKTFLCRVVSNSMVRAKAVVKT